MQSQVAPDGVQYDAETGERLRQAVRETELPPAVSDLADLYEEVVGDRNRFLWKWVQYLFEEAVTLSCVPDRHAPRTHETKTILVMYCTLLDDLAEKHGDVRTFWEVAGAVYPGGDPDWSNPDVDREYAQVTKAVWEAAEERMEAAPRYEEFRDQTMFDLRQVVTAMDYSFQLTDRPEIANIEETWRFDTHNIMMYVFAHVDLMHSPSFSTGDYADLREILAVGEEMWRIGNWVITWEREIEEGDFSAGVVVEALREGVVSHETLARVEAGEVAPEVVRESIRESGIEQQFIEEWVRRRDALRARDHDVESFDVEAFVDGLETVLRQHLATRGYR